MASEALVDLSYRGLVLGKRVRLLQVGPQSAYVAHDAPMPVGTHLVLTVDQSLTIPAQVARVREADTKDGPAGMWLWANVVEDHARAWWDAHVTADDPRIPEPAGGRIRTEAPVVPAPAATPAVAPPVAPAAEPAPTPEAQPAVAAEDEAEAEATPAVAAAAEAEATPAVAAADEAEAKARAMHEDVQAEEGERPESREDGTESEASSTERFAALESMAQAMEDDRDPDDSGYDIHIRASTNVEFVPMAGYEAGEGYAADASYEAAEGDTGGEAQERRPRGTAVMTAVEIADVLGMAPLTDDDGDGDDEAEPVGRHREFRTTHVMSAVEVAEVLQSSTPEPPKDEGKDEGKGKGRKRRGRKRR